MSNFFTIWLFYGISLQDIGDTLRIRSVDPGATFGVQSFDLTGVMPFVVPNLPVSLSIKGLKDDGSILTFNYLDASATNLTQNNYAMGSDWASGITELRVTTLQAGFAAAIDNLTLNVQQSSPTPVSAPATAALVTGGLGLLALGRRRNKRAE